MSRLNQLAKDSIVYGVGGVLSKGVSFLLLPVYTRIFTPADYGTIEMMTVIIGLLTAVLVMGMDAAQSFFFFEQKKKGEGQQKIVVSAILQWRIIWGLAIVLIAGSLSPLLNTWFFDGGLSWVYFAVAFSHALFSTIMGQSVEVFRLLYRPWPYVIIGLANTLLAASSILALVLIFDQGIFGYFLGSALASMLVALLGWYLVREYIDFSQLHYAWWQRLLRFGAPLLPAGLAFYAMSTMDRWFIQYYRGAEELGVYAIGAKFALIMALGIETFRKAWWPLAMDAMHSDDGPETFRMIARLYMGVGVALVIILTLCSPWLVEWLTTPAYRSAWPIVGILAWPSLFYGFYLIGSVGIWKVEKTYLSIYLMSGAAILNLFLNYLLVPEYGGIGAAIATAITYFIWIVVSFIVSERCWKIEFPVRVMTLQVFAGSVIVALIVTQTINLGIWALLLLIALSIIIAVSGLNKSRRQKLWIYIRANK